MREDFAKASHIFSTKNIGIFQILKYEILTKRQLTTSLVLNNQAQFVMIAGMIRLQQLFVGCWVIVVVQHVISACPFTYCNACFT